MIVPRVIPRSRRLVRFDRGRVWTHSCVRRHALATERQVRRAPYPSPIAALESTRPWDALARRLRAEPAESLTRERCDRKGGAAQKRTNGGRNVVVRSNGFALPHPRTARGRRDGCRLQG